jgi:hypothetical protein
MGVRLDFGVCQLVGRYSLPHTGSTPRVLSNEVRSSSHARRASFPCLDGANALRRRIEATAREVSGRPGRRDASGSFASGVVRSPSISG